MTWDEVATKEGRIYCQTKDTWCAMVNMNTGECIRDKCVQDDPELTKEEKQ